MENNFYVYEWYNLETNEVFYVGKGSKTKGLRNFQMSIDVICALLSNESPYHRSPGSAGES